MRHYYAKARCFLGDTDLIEGRAGWRKCGAVAGWDSIKESTPVKTWVGVECLACLKSKPGPKPKRRKSS